MHLRCIDREDRLALLDKADALLVEIWKALPQGLPCLGSRHVVAATYQEVTGNDDDREAPASMTGGS